MFRWLITFWHSLAGPAPATVPEEVEWRPSGIRQKDEFSRYDPKLQARALARQQREVEALRRKVTKRTRPKPERAKPAPPVSLRAVAGERRARQ